MLINQKNKVITSRLKNAIRAHYPDYLIEAFCLGIFMVSACLATVLLEYPESPFHHALPNPTLRRFLIGLAMGLTAVALIYSPWGKRSGAHMNPSVTLTFWRLGKIKGPDATFYILFQCLGGWAGVALCAFFLPSAMAHPAVAYAVTVPGPQGSFVAWIAEFAISFGLMGMVLITSNRATLARWTGVFAGLLIALYIVVEAPLSGMSMNPARTLGSAIVSGLFTEFWIYLTAPPLGMLASGEIYKRFAARTFHAKLTHPSGGLS